MWEERGYYLNEDGLPPLPTNVLLLLMPNTDFLKPIYSIVIGSLCLKLCTTNSNED